jgi:hypothetical protein
MYVAFSHYTASTSPSGVFGKVDHTAQQTRQGNLRQSVTYTIGILGVSVLEN